MTAPVSPCSLCGGELELRRRAEPGLPYPYKCPDCGGVYTGWFAADGSEYCDDNDDLDGKPPWDPDYEGRPPPRCEWGVDCSKFSMPETPSPGPSCAARLTWWPPPAGYPVAAIEHEPGCSELGTAAGAAGGCTMSHLPLTHLYDRDGEPDLMAISDAILAVGGEFAEDFVRGRRILTDENAAQVAAEIRAYWAAP
jgi:hypothetical protein